jgi:prepilin-type N-terminal cleavage/methylation domain-containing protein
MAASAPADSASARALEDAMPVRGARGFTLVELLVVIAILGILMGLLFPIARSAKDQTNRNACMNNLRIIAQAVQAHHQERGVYPPPPGLRGADGYAVSGLTGAHGIPDGGITGLALSGHGLSRTTMWCPVDPYPERLSGAEARSVLRDETDSSYAYGYNYYGYVTSADGTPFPVASEEAARFFFGDPQAVDSSILPTDAVRKWDLGLIKTTAGANGTLYSPHGMFRGLWNYRAPADTVITFCPHHRVGSSDALLVVTTGGDAEVVKFDPPFNEQGNRAMLGGHLERKPDPNVPRLKPGIDWRSNRGAYVLKNGRLVEDPSTIADVPSEAPRELRQVGDPPDKVYGPRMPVVELRPVTFSASELANNMQPAAGDRYGWFDTTVDVEAGDMVMVVAHAQWCWVPNVWTKDAADPAAQWVRPTRFNDPAERQTYDEMVTTDEHPVKDASGRVVRYEKYFWFSPEGDSVEARTKTSLGGMLLPGQPHNLLVGYFGDLSQPVEHDRVQAVGSRYARLITAADIPAGLTTTTLKLSLNDTAGAGAYADNLGWCEAWIAVYRPRDVNAPVGAGG